MNPNLTLTIDLHVKPSDEFKQHLLDVLNDPEIAEIPPEGASRFVHAIQAAQQKVAPDAPDDTKLSTLLTEVLSCILSDAFEEHNPPQHMLEFRVKRITGSETVVMPVPEGVQPQIITVAKQA